MPRRTHRDDTEFAVLQLAETGFEHIGVPLASIVGRLARWKGLNEEAARSRVRAVMPGLVERRLVKVERRSRGSVVKIDTKGID